MKIRTEAVLTEEDVIRYGHVHFIYKLTVTFKPTHVEISGSQETIKRFLIKHWFADDFTAYDDFMVEYLAHLKDNKPLMLNKRLKSASNAD